MVVTLGDSCGFGHSHSMSYQSEIHPRLQWVCVATVSHEVERLKAMWPVAEKSMRIVLCVDFERCAVTDYLGGS